MRLILGLYVILVAALWFLGLGLNELRVSLLLMLSVDGIAIEDTPLLFKFLVIVSENNTVLKYPIYSEILCLPHLFFAAIYSYRLQCSNLDGRLHKFLHAGVLISLIEIVMVLCAVCYGLYVIFARIEVLEEVRSSFWISIVHYLTLFVAIVLLVRLAVFLRGYYSEASRQAE